MGNLGVKHGTKLKFRPPHQFWSHPSRSHLIGVPLTRFILPKDQDVFYHCRRQLWSTDAPQTCELRVQRKKREPCWIRLEMSITLASEGETPRWRVILSDITERKYMEHALQDSEARYRGLHESLRDPFAQVAMDGRFIDCNELYCQMVGYTHEELLTRRYQDLTPERWQAFEASIVHEQVLPRGHSDIYEKEYRCKDGTLIPVELRTILIRDAAGQPNAMWSIVRDITERKRVEAALHQHATQDELTGASNRRHFFIMAGDALKRARRLQRPLALALIDLDHLKHLNDTYGHGAGDQALRGLAQVCQQHLREIDVFARLGGDEFIVLLPEATLQQAYDALERIRLTLATQPIELAGTPVAITFSAGIAGWRGESESLETLLERADHVLYQTKKAGRNRVGIEAAKAFPEHLTPSSVASPKTPTPANNAERRHHTRRAVTCGIQLRVIKGSPTTTAPGIHHAIARDLNERGVQLVIEQPHPVQTSLMLAIADDANGWERLTLQVGTVVWVRPLPDENRCALGIQFSEPEPVLALA
jgi:diguanylate cyclase (GGDEF)-like protein/PAS domain S-box-containing protein